MVRRRSPSGGGPSLGQRAALSSRGVRVTRLVLSIVRHGRVALPVQVCLGAVEAAICARCCCPLDPRTSAVAAAVGHPVWELVCPRCVTDVDRATLAAVEAGVGFAGYLPEMPTDVAFVVPDRSPLGDAT